MKWVFRSVFNWYYSKKVIFIESQFKFMVVLVSKKLYHWYSIVRKTFLSNQTYLMCLILVVISFSAERPFENPRERFIPSSHFSNGPFKIASSRSPNDSIFVGQ